MRRIKITLHGKGGELDCRIVEAKEGSDPYEGEKVNAAIRDLAAACTFACGDSITIEEID